MNALNQLTEAMVTFAVICAGALWLLGASKGAGKLLLGGILAAAIIPFGTGLIAAVGNALPAVVVPSGCADSNVPTILALLAVGVVGITGWTRFVNRRRAIEAWRMKSRRPTSLKRRIYEDED